MTAQSEVGASSHEAAQFSPPRTGCYPGHWAGRFIWDRGESLPYNAYLMFRKTLDLHGAPLRAARLHITAALKYMLWVNGRYVASGPARSSPEWKSYDTHDVSRLLHAGRNAIAALCWFTGVPNNYANDERAGLWAQMEYLDENGRMHTLGSDETWRVRQAQGFHRDMPSYGGVTPEIYDARMDPPDWMNVGFDDSRWENACCLKSGEYRGDPAKMASWTYLEPRQTPPMREREVAPVSVLFVGEADAGLYGADETNLQSRMGGQDISPLRNARAEGVQNLITNTGEPALFQNNPVSSSPLTNGFAGQRCVVFAAVDREDPLPDAESFRRVPETLACGAGALLRQEGRLNAHGEIDLAPLIGGAREGRTAYVYVPFVIEKEGQWTVGAGADWWLECYVDGDKVLDTMEEGNRFHPVSFADQRTTITLARGAHLLVARAISGSGGSVFACGLCQADKTARVLDPCVTLDFGRTHNAFPCIEFEAPAGAVIEIAAGGRMLPDGRVTWGDNKAVWSRPARCVASGGRQRWRVFEPRPVRVLHVVFRNIQEPIRVFSVKLISWEYPAEQRGSFACSDSVLSRLWQAGVDTAYLHMDDTLIFDVVRERESYAFIGEAEQGHLALAAGYGDLPFAHWHLKQTLRSQVPSGLFPIVLGSYALRNAGFPIPATPSKVCNCLLTPNHMPFVAIGIRNRYWHFGDDAMLREWYPALIRLADWFLRKSDDSGLLYNLPGQIWFDWVSDQELRGANFECNAIYCKMLESVGEIAAWLGRSEEAEEWRRKAARVRDALRAMHWNEGRGLFCDSVLDGRQSPFITELANGMALLYDIADENQKQKIVTALTRRENGCTPVTILYFYYLIEGLIKAGAVDYAMQRMSASNKKMVALSDPPTFWEEWPGFKSTHLAGNSPLHFGGAGVVWTLSSRVLGVQATTPGFATCRVQPQCGHLQWARGVVPAAPGDIHVEWRKDADAFTLGVRLPDALPTELVLPCRPGRESVLSHNGTRYACRDMKGAGAIECSDEGVIVRTAGGRHAVELKF